MPLKYEDYAGRVKDKSKLDLQLDQTNAGIDKHLTDIASGLIDLDGLTAKLELKHAILKDLETNYPRDVSRQRTELLRAWKHEFGSKATYARLLRVCVATSNADSAETVVRLLNQNLEIENCDTPTTSKDLISPSKCQSHLEYLKNVYCIDCHCLVCSECTQREELHYGHEYKFTQELKASLKNQLVPLRKNLTHCIERIKIAESSVVRQSGSVKSQIDSTFEDFEKIIRARKLELLEEAALKESNKLKKLSSQKEEVSTALQSVTKSIEKCEQSADDTFIEDYASIESLLKTEGKYLEKKNLSPVVVADIGAELNCRDDLIHLCQNNTKLTQLQVECTVSGKGLQSSEVDATSEFEISDIRLSNGKLLKQSQVVQCHLKRLACSTTTECHVKNTKDGVYQVQYTPTLRGHHELTVTVTEQEVQGSPFPVFVSVPLMQPGKIVKTFPTDSSAIDVAVTSSNRIIVATIEKLLLLDSEGKCINSFSRLVDEKYMGVAVDNINDNVYAIVFKKKTNLVSYVITHRRKDSAKFCVLKLNSDLSSILQECEFEDIEGWWFSGVAVVGDEVMVCCHKTNTIKVFSKKLMFVREIDFGIRNIRDICSDKEGKLYVSDASGQVHVSKNGALLQYLPVDEPCGICTAGDSVYITSYAGMVHIWHLGQYLGSFGQKGASQGEFQDINGVGVDEDGFVYVCDSKGVQKF